ncbi:hypothetical protein MNBD_IGNAVI01-1561 [hydrothermal vent metagenome]|uniref:Bacterial surface antigen (D15) domain-containing protein n=1 Tax=hydrothermal vent metagenome TaxID=652676 RepID=A0A3B1BFI6_9ZZZZ
MNHKNNHNIIKLILILVLFGAFNIWGQDSTASGDTAKPKMFDWFAYPFAFYTPEVNLAFGAGGITYFRTSHRKGTRPSKVTLSAYYSINHQYLVYLYPVVFFNRNMDEASAEIYFENKIDKLYGIGSDAPDIENPAFQYTDFSIIVKFKREFIKDFFATVAYEYINYKIPDPKDNPYLNTDAVYGAQGGNISGLGYGLTYDNRDNVFFPSRGNLLEFYALHFGSFLGSDYKFSNFFFDLRSYNAITKDDNIIAVQGYAAITTGEPPFYALPKLGGQHMMRGYFEGRYRDKQYLMLQVEYRKFLFWKFGGVLFIGMGDVAGKFSDFGLKNIKYSYGAGLRYILDEDEKINLRVDIGFGKDTMGFYFGVEDAF